MTSAGRRPNETLRHSTTPAAAPASYTHNITIYSAEHLTQNVSCRSSAVSTMFATEFLLAHSQTWFSPRCYGRTHDATRGRKRTELLHDMTEYKTDIHLIVLASRNRAAKKKSYVAQRSVKLHGVKLLRQFLARG